jgi:Heterokaryon incompatibility protein (HET)
MRFLNTSTLRFESVPDSELHQEGNKYAILSHRWGKEEGEISFENIRSSRDVSNKKGFAKLKGFCDLALSADCRYAWIDTCCINKGDSAELGEAINSMYRWYYGSKICIVYLEDVPQRQMADSEWFDRGWTLQELISPKDVSFFDHDWTPLGTKGELLPMLSDKTGIPQSVLSHETKLSSWSVAQRMSWAAKRITTRVEDRAYSLMGLFAVNMPMIYGEREKAFLRLQEHIIQQTKDESVFAWDFDPTDKPSTYSGLFAPSLSSFVGCSYFSSSPGSSGFSEANGELSIRLRTYPQGMETYLAVLNCTSNSSEGRTAILITRLANEDEYVRVKTSQGLSRMWVEASRLESFKERLIRVPVHPSEPPLNMVHGFWLRTLQPPGYAHCHPAILSCGQPSDTDQVCVGERGTGTAGIVHMEPKNSSAQSGWSKIHWLKFGFDQEFNPVLLLGNGDSPDLNYPSQTRLKPNQRSFQQAVAAGSESKDHDEIMNNRWIGAKAGNPSKSHGWPSGVCVLQVSRKQGFSANINALNLGISIQLQPYRSPTAAPKEMTDSSGLPLSPRKIWVVDITGTGGSSPEWEHRQSDCGLYAMLLFGVIPALGGCGCCVQAADQERHERNAVRNHVVRLGNLG